MRQPIRYLALLLYYGFAKHIPTVSILRPIALSLRYFLCKMLFEEIGVNIWIAQGANFGLGDTIKIGDNSGLGKNCHIRNAIVGQKVLMGPDFLYISTNHAFANTEVPIKFQAREPVRTLVIEDGVWIGARVIVLPGVRIGKESIIGAGSVVTKDVPPYSIVAGNPARLIRTRDRQRHNHINS